MYDYLKKLITPDMVFFGVPTGPSTAADLTGKNPEIQCFGTHPNVPVISTFQPPNVVTDGGFNIWTDENDLTHWSETQNGASTVNREATEKVEGDYSCRIDVDASNNMGRLVQTLIPLTPNKKYKAVIHYKNSVAGKTFYFNFMDATTVVGLKADGTWTATAGNIVLENSLVWKEFSIEFTAHADYSSYYFELKRKSASSSSIYFDDISIEELKPSLINPSVGWVFGGDDYIQLASPIVGTDPFSVFALVNYPEIPTTDGEVVVGNYNGWYRGFTISVISNGKARLHVGRASDTSVKSAISSEAISLNTWHLIGGIYDGVKPIAVLDDVLTAGDDYSPIEAELANIKIGKANWLTNYFKGYAALLLIVDGAWSQQQVDNFILNIKGLFSPRSF